MTLLWLADVLRAAGLTVVEHQNFRNADGDLVSWKTHRRPGSWEPRYGLVHATAAPRTQSDETQVRIVRDGRSDLLGPIANACVDRQGRWHILSAGRCNSTLTGTAGPFEGLGNTYALSTEACNDNLSEPWPAIQYQSYVRGWAAWVKRMGWTSAQLVGHKEHTPGRKTDPTFSMTQFRADVARAMSGGGLATGGVDDVWCSYGGKGPNVEYLQFRLRYSVDPDLTVDGDYGAKTAAALKLAEARVGATTDGRTYGPLNAIRLDMVWGQKYAGQRGPQGPAGPAGPQGPKGEPGPAGNLTVEQVVGEVGATLVAASKTARAS